MGQDPNYFEAQKWEVLQELGALGTSAKGKSQKLLRVIKWTPGDPEKYDLRFWYRRDGEDPKPGKGISLSLDEMRELVKICKSLDLD